MEQHEGVDPVETMGLEGGEPCLDFVNTASGRSEGPLREKLHGYGDLVTFAERVGVVEPELGARLRSLAAEAPAEAEAVLERARALREAIFRLFARPSSSAADLVLLGEEAGRAAAARRLMAEGDGYRFSWPQSDRLERPLWPLAFSAGDLLTSEERNRVKECAADNCNWLFLDVSRNRSRRWCDMAVCGNRAKARRFSERQRRG
jgi:predicted RNA-binding Zn ribbon-like protein